VTTKERRSREKVRRQQEILLAARRVFFSKGIHLATVDDVAAAADLSKGSIYLYFDNKETLLAHLLLEGLQVLLQELEAASSSPESLSAEQRVCKLARAYYQFAQEHPYDFRLLMAIDRGGFQDSVPADVYARILTDSIQGLEMVAEAVRLGVEEGSFVAADPAQAAGSLWAALHGVLVLMGHSLRRQMFGADLEEMFESTLEFQLRGLRTT